MDNKREIRFTDAKYDEIFRIPDGGKIIVHYSWGEQCIFICTYIDDYHMYVGGTVYHVHQFAEQMEHYGHTFEPYEGE